LANEKSLKVNAFTVQEKDFQNFGDDQLTAYSGDETLLN
jgi:hypothetical protein